MSKTQTDLLADDCAFIDGVATVTDKCLAAVHALVTGGALEMYPHDYLTVAKALERLLRLHAMVSIARTYNNAIGDVVSGSQELAFAAPGLGFGPVIHK